jgi:hypothetical protein
VDRGWVTRERSEFAAAWVLVGAVGIAMFYWLRDQPFYYDAAGYMDASRAISAHGLFSPWIFSDIRSYGYPFFLTSSLGLARLLHHGPHAGVFITQWPIFVGSAWLAAGSLFRSSRVRLLAFVCIAANPLLVVYSAEAFTESLTLSCVLLAVTSLGRASRSGSRRAAVWLVAGAAVSSYAMVVRPGSVLIPVCYALAAAGVLCAGRKRSSWIVAGGTAMVVVAALVAPLVPQVVINHRYYHSWSPLPTYDIEGLQARAGLTIVRYIGNVAPCGRPAIAFYNPNPPAIAVTANTLDAVRYYTTSLPGGPEMLLLHVFSGFDPRPFLIDQHAFGAHYERVLQALTLALLFAAAFGAVRAVTRLRESRWRMRVDVAFLGAVMVVFLGILATSATEYRFGSVPLIGVSLLAAYGVSQRWQPRRQDVAVVIAGYAGALLMWVTLSDLVLSTSAQWQLCS